MDIKEFGGKYIKAQKEAWKGNFDDLEAIESPDVIFHVGPLGEMVGWEAHKQYIQSNSQATSDLHQDFKYLAGDGNLFAISYKSRGTAINDIPAFSIAKGHNLTVDYLFVLQVQNGKIIEVWANGSLNISD